MKNTGVNRLLLALYLLILCVQLLIATVSAADNGKNDLYRLMKENTSQPLDTQISVLQHYLQEHPADGLAHTLLVQRYAMRKNLDEGIHYFESLCENPGNYGKAWQALAEIFNRKNEFKQMARCYREWLKIADPSPSVLGRILAFNTSHPHLSVDYSDYISRFASSENKLIATAMVRFYAGKYTEAAEIFSRFTPEMLSSMVIREVYGYSQYSSANYPGAIDIWSEGLNHARQTNDLHYQALLLGNIGKANLMADQYEDAIHCFAEAERLAGEYGDYDLREVNLGNAGNALQLKSDFEAAASRYHAAIDLAKQLHLGDHLDRWYQGYGEVLYNLAQYDGALTAFESALNVAKATGDLKKETECFVNIGDVYFSLKQYSLAKKVFQKSYELAKENKFSAQMDNALGRLASILVLENQFDEAINIYRSFLGKTSYLLNDVYWLHQIAEIYQQQGKLNQAQKALNKALAYAREFAYQPYIAWTLSMLAKVEKLIGLYDDALKKLNEAANLAASFNDADLSFQINLNYGDCYSDLDNLPAAIKYYQQAVFKAEAINQTLKAEQFRIDQFEKVANAYAKIVNCYYRQYQLTSKKTYLDSLFYFKEIGSGRSLKSAEKRHSVSNETHFRDDRNYRDFMKLSIRLRKQQRKLREKATSFQPDEIWETLIAKVEAARYSLIGKQLQLKSVAGNNIPNHFEELPEIAEIRDKMHDYHASLLIYHISSEDAFAFIVTADTNLVVSLPVKKAQLLHDIQRLIAPFHSVSDENFLQTPFEAELAYQLYQALVEPIEQKIKLPQRVIIMPDLAMINLPFGLLLRERPAQPVYFPTTHSGKYAANFLQQNYNFSYTPCTSFLMQVSHHQSNGNRLLAFADPFDQDQILGKFEKKLRSDDNWLFLPLPFAQTEVEAIKSLYPSTTIYRNSEATKRLFFEKAPQSKIIHLATHGFANTEFDAFSGLVFAMTEDSTDDGLLMGYEISNLRLNCDLVALSACETGRGKLIAGEGVLGLPRLFLSAGARSVLMTHWKVDDFFTSQLMPAFYTQYLNQNLPKIDALAAAKRASLAKIEKINDVYYQHPFFWASFTLFGDPGTEKNQTSNTTSLLTVMIIISATIFLFGALLLGWRNKHLRRLQN